MRQEEIVVRRDGISVVKIRQKSRSDKDNVTICRYVRSNEYIDIYFYDHGGISVISTFRCPETSDGYFDEALDGMEAFILSLASELRDNMFDIRIACAVFDALVAIDANT